MFTIDQHIEMKIYSFLPFPISPSRRSSPTSASRSEASMSSSAGKTMPGVSTMYTFSPSLPTLTSAKDRVTPALAPTVAHAVGGGEREACFILIFEWERKITENNYFLLLFFKGERIKERGGGKIEGEVASVSTMIEESILFFLIKHSSYLSLKSLSSFFWTESLLYFPRLSLSFFLPVSISPFFYFLFFQK